MVNPIIMFGVPKSQIQLSTSTEVDLLLKKYGVHETSRIFSTGGDSEEGYFGFVISAEENWLEDWMRKSPNVPYERRSLDCTSIVLGPHQTYPPCGTEWVVHVDVRNAWRSFRKDIESNSLGIVSNIPKLVVVFD